MRSNIKTRTVLFSNGLVKDAPLQIPAEDYSIADAGGLIRKSYLEWRFGPQNRSIMSDEVVVSSLGKSHYFEGALGGYKARLTPEKFEALRSYTDCDLALSVEVVRFRAAKQGRTMSNSEVYNEAAKNEALSAELRECLLSMAKAVLSV